MGIQASKSRAILDDLKPDLVLRRLVQGQVAQAGRAGGPDAVSARARWRCRSSRVAIGMPVVLVVNAVSRKAVGVGEPQLRAGVWPFLADDQPHSFRSALEDIADNFGDPGAAADLTIRLDGHRPRGGRDLQDGLVDGLGDGRADRVRQPPASLREPGDELVGSAGGVGMNQRLASGPVLLQQLGQGELGRGDGVSGSTAARVARLSRLATGSRSRRFRGRPRPSEDGARRSSSRSRWRPASWIETVRAPRPGPRSPALRRPGPCSWPCSRHANGPRPALLVLHGGPSVRPC